MIFDCFMYFDEDMLLDLRMNILNKYVNYFVIVESKYTHQGKIKGKNFDKNKFKKFEDKIIYIYDKNNFYCDDPWKQENYQRNLISKGLVNANMEDYIIISDLDEIPNPKKINQIYNYKFSVFNQKVFYYKLNLQSLSELNWYGSRCCKKKYLSTPQKLRSEKIKNYPFWRIDKFYKKKFNIIDDGGWHFTYLKTTDDIIKKIKSFAHLEFNQSKYLNKKNIEQKILNGEDIFNRNFKYKRINIKNGTFPEYLIANLKNYSKWFL
jgi:beta-1,4-mannosyl-glycoprotein beta-1,4-N-acetylglucosaminyltransferase